MTSNDLMVLPDVQSSLDRRNIPIEKVGVKGIKTPILVKTVLGSQHTVADVEMYVSLPADKKAPTCPASGLCSKASTSLFALLF